MNFGPDNEYLICNALRSDGLRILGVFAIRKDDETRLSLPEKILTLSRNDGIDGLSREQIDSTPLALVELVEDDPVLKLQDDTVDDKFEEVSLNELRARITNFCLGRSVIGLIDSESSHREVLSFVNSVLATPEASHNNEDPIKIGQYI